MGKKHNRAKDAQQRGTLKLLQTLVIVLAIGLGVTVAVGLRDVLADQGGFTSWLVPIVFAAVLTAVMAGLWHVTLGMAAHVDPLNPRQVWTVIAFALALTGVHGATSMPFLASAIGGADAVQHHQELAVTKLSVAADTIAGNAEARERVQTGLARETTFISQLLSDEIGGSGASRIPGFGPIAEDIDTALRALRRGSESFNGRSAALSAQLNVARNHIARAQDASLAGDEKRFSEEAGAARSTLSALASGSGMSIDFGYDFARSSVPGLRAIAPRLDQVLREAAYGTSRVELPVYVPISRPVAVLRYPDAVPLAWSVAVAVDFLGLFALIGLLMFYKVIWRF